MMTRPLALAFVFISTYQTNPRSSSVKRLESSSMASPSSTTAPPGQGRKCRFFEAASTGDLPLFKRLTDEFQKLDLKIENIKDAEGQTALHFAAAKGRLEVCEYLLEEVKLDIDVRDGLGRTPLHHAAANENLLAAVYLLEHGANPNAKTIKWRTPLHCAVEKGPKELLKLLLSKGADIDAMGNFGCGTPLQLAISKGPKEFVEFLLDNNADPNAISFDLTTPLLVAVVDGKFDCMKLLLKGGADPNLCSTKAMTPLWDAANQGWTDAIDCLLNAGADPNFTNNAGMTPVEIAALKGSLQAVMILFPVTKPIPTIPDWSVAGLTLHVHTDEAEEERQKKLEEYFSLSKSKGTEAFNREDYFGAIKLYQEASYCKKDAAVLSNQSLCWARLNEGGLALEMAKLCSFIRPEWPKGYYRQGAALMLLKDFGKAADAFYKAWKMAVDNKDIEHAFREAIGAQINKLRSFPELKIE